MLTTTSHTALLSASKSKGVAMSEQVIRLVYPPHLLDVPIINQLIRRYNLTVNILRAQVAPNEGWVDIQLTGNAAAIEDAITWLSGQGIVVQHLA
jgi:ABC-type methionine transport system ATPase subunit